MKLKPLGKLFVAFLIYIAFFGIPQGLYILIHNVIVDEHLPLALFAIFSILVWYVIVDYAERKMRTEESKKIRGK